MNWYKKAKIRDSSYGLIAEPTVCVVCHRWSTLDEDGNHEWKYYHEMTPEEQIQVDNIQKQSGGATNFKLETCDMCRIKQNDPTL